MAITAGMVKELREMTGAGMMDCKKALAATEGDMDKAVEFLREKGLATAQKKASRVAAEGLCKTLVSADENTRNVKLYHLIFCIYFITHCIDMGNRRPNKLYSMVC